MGDERKGSKRKRMTRALSITEGASIHQFRNVDRSTNNGDRTHRIMKGERGAAEGTEGAKEKASAEKTLLGVVEIKRHQQQRELHFLLLLLTKTVLVALVDRPRGPVDPAADTRGHAQEELVVHKVPHLSVFPLLKRRRRRSGRKQEEKMSFCPSFEFFSSFTLSILLLCIPSSFFPRGEGQERERERDRQRSA